MVLHVTVEEVFSAQDFHVHGQVITKSFSLQQNVLCNFTASLRL